MGGRRETLLKALQILAWVLLTITFCKHVVYYPFFREGAWGVDYGKHYVAAREVLAGRSPFVGENYLGFNYPQFTAWLYLFLAAFSLEGAEKVWNLCNALFVVAAFFTIVVYYRPKPRESADMRSRGALDPAAALWVRDHWASVSALLYAVFAPWFMDFHCGNIEPLNLILIVALGAALIRRADGVAGVVLAMACLVKILPVFFLLPLAMARRWRVVSVCMAAMAVYASILFASELWRPGDGWWRWEVSLYANTLPHVAFEYRDLSRSPAAIAARSFSSLLWNSQPAFDLATRAVSLVLLAAYVGVLIAARRFLRRSWRDGVAFTALAIVIVSPLIEYHHLIWSIPAYLFLVVDYVEGRVRHGFFALAGGLWAAIFLCRYWTDLGPSGGVHPLDIATLLSVVLWVAMAVRILRMRADATVA